MGSPPLRGVHGPFPTPLAPQPYPSHFRAHSEAQHLHTTGQTNERKQDCESGKGLHVDVQPRGFANIVHNYHNWRCNQHGLSPPQSAPRPRSVKTDHGSMHTKRLREWCDKGIDRRTASESMQSIQSNNSTMPRVLIRYPVSNDNNSVEKLPIV